MIKQDSMPPGLRRVLPYLAVTAVLLVGVPTIEYFHRLVAERTDQLHRMEALGVLSRLRAQVETEINSVLFLTRGLVTFIAVEPESTAEQWRALSAEIIRSTRHVQSIGLSPGNVIRFVYPLEGNERAIGLDYRKNSDQWPAVERAINVGDTVLAGPLELVQGGRGLIARTPIFARPDPMQKPVYWGLASVVIDADSLFRAAGIQPRVGNYNIAIIGRDGLGLQGEMIQGSREVLEQGIARLEVFFPNGRWVMAATPAAGGELFWHGRQLVRVLGYPLLIVLGLLLLVLTRLYHSSRGEAMRDELTGLPNRRLLMERLTQLVAMQKRGGSGFALLFIDMNHFKPINDRYGHGAGDAVLKEVGHRLQSAVRSSDTVARAGGDEFMILLPSVASEAAARQVAKKLEQVLQGPFVYQLQPLQLSAAIGYALCPNDSDQIETLVRLADERMFRQKVKDKASRSEREPACTP